MKERKKKNEERKKIRKQKNKKRKIKMPLSSFWLHLNLREI
jgi:hypothetical protein